jgi:hypothetical protein
MTVATDSRRASLVRQNTEAASARSVAAGASAMLAFAIATISRLNPLKLPKDGANSIARVDKLERGEEEVGSA